MPEFFIPDPTVFRESKFKRLFFVETSADHQVTGTHDGRMPGV